MGSPLAAAAFVVPAVLVAVGVAAGLTALLGSGFYEQFGLPDPGELTKLALPVVRVIAEAASVITVGALLFTAFLVPAQRSGAIGPGGYAGLRTASGWAIVWAVAALMMVPLTVADQAGRPVGDAMRLDVLLASVPVLQVTQAWLLVAGMALVLAIAARAVLRWGWAVLMFGLGLLTLTPVALTGHSASGGAHDYATDSLLFHIVAASLWVGGLVALLAHLRRGGEYPAVATRRFSALALGCWIVMAISGMANALVRLSVGELFSTTYGLLVLAKTGALVALGVFGVGQRRRGVRAVLERGDAVALVRLGGSEVLLMMATLGLAVALGRTAPPPVGSLSVRQLLLGYDLPGPPTVLRMVLDWRFDLAYGTVALVAIAFYLLGVRTLARRGDRWPAGRTAAWLAGWLLVLVATSSGIGRYAPAMFSVHMGQHMLLSMLAPVLLVLGGPVTLALRALPSAGSGPPGPREWLLAGVHSPVSRVLTHPVVALLLFTGSFYALYLSGLFDAALSQHWAHLVMNAHFMLTGYLFYWPVIGVDPAPRRLPYPGRLGMVFASMPFHAFFGVIVMSSATVIGENFYRSLALPWVPDLLADQRLGGGLAWASGELPLLVVMVALLIQWSRSDERDARRSDRRADAGHDEERTAYNAMLRTLADRDGGTRR
jgi:putative copper resistance protein D